MKQPKRAGVGRLVAVVGIVLVVAAACGGGGASDDELIAALETVMAEDAIPGLEYDANCMASGVVDALGGADQIESKYGVTAATVEATGDIQAELDRATAEGVADAVWDCSDFVGLMASGFLDSGATQEQSDCITAKIPEEPVRLMIASSFMGDEGSTVAEEATSQLFEVAFDAAAECGLG